IASFRVSMILFIFFFQAEDGIRDFHVTGVQTCALPILMFVHLGDRGYYDLGSGLHGIIGGGSVANYQKLYRDNSRQPRQLALQTQVPTQYVYDDHDWGPKDRKSTRLNSSHVKISYAVFCL